MTMRRFVLAIVFLLSTVAAAWAQSFAPDQMEALKARITTFEAGIRSFDYNVMAEVIPRKVWNHIKTEAKVNDAQLVEGIKTALSKAFETVEIVDFKMDVPAATTHALSDGMLYMLIPTSTTMEIKNSGKFVTTSSTLAFVEEGKWYLMRVSDKQQVDVLHQVYPAFKTVTLPDDKTEKIEEPKP
jgi:hypothetical protein